MQHCLCKYYQDCSNYDPGLTLTYFTPRSNWGESENYYFLETIAALGLKVALTIQLNKLMKLSKYQGQGHSLTLVKGQTDFKVKTCFSQKQSGNLEPKLIGKLKGELE